MFDNYYKLSLLLLFVSINLGLIGQDTIRDISKTLIVSPSAQQVFIGDSFDKNTDSCFAFETRIESEMNSIQFPIGLLDGCWIAYYSNGRIAFKVNFLNGRLEGDYLHYYMSGKLKLKTIMKEGFYNGNYIEYHENGQKSCETYYENGQASWEGTKIWNEKGEEIEKADINYKPM